MSTWIKRLFCPPRRRFKIVEKPAPPRILLAHSCHLGLLQCLAEANARRHEGVAFLIGRTDGRTALCLQAVRPKAKTTLGSFHVPASEIAKVVALATELDLQIVAQVHTHPAEAFHSEGDEDGANIRFDGFASIVIPHYGASLPCFAGSAIYVFERQNGWRSVPLENLRVLEDAIFT